MPGEGQSHRQGGAPDTTGAYELRPEGRHLGSHVRMVLGAVGLLLTMALVAYAAVRFDSLFTPSTGPVASPVAASASTPAASPTGPTAQQAIRRCQAVWAAQGPVLDAAARSLAQWQVHVDAMNQLVAGQISVAQASAFWAKSRIGAAERVQSFEQADRRLGRVQTTCSARGVQPAGRATEARLRACVLGVRDRSGAVDEAEQSIATWQDHINDMEMFRMGQMSAKTAGQMWSKNWHKGQHQLDSYRARAKTATDQHC